MMTRQPDLTVGVEFEEVDDTGTVHHYRILGIVEPSRSIIETHVDHSRQMSLEGITEAYTRLVNRPAGDASAFETAFSLPL
jgi:hypothetical protein